MINSPDAERSPQDWRWLLPNAILFIHEEALAEHGGSPGIRDMGVIESALSRPVNLAHDGDPDAADLAARILRLRYRQEPWFRGREQTHSLFNRPYLSRQQWLWSGIRKGRCGPGHGKCRGWPLYRIRTGIVVPLAIEGTPNAFALMA